MEVIGKIKLINDTQTFDSGFTKREFVVTTQEQYPQDIKMELIKDKTTLIDAYQVGDEVTVSFNLRGNEYNGRYYVNLQAWKLAKGAGAPEQQAAPADPAGFPTIPAPETSDSGADAEDDLPF